MYFAFTIRGEDLLRGEGSYDLPREDGMILEKDPGIMYFYGSKTVNPDNSAELRLIGGQVIQTVDDIRDLETIAGMPRIK